jgi:MraZ protein
LLVESELRSLAGAAKADPEIPGPQRRAFFRHYFSQAEPCPLDPQGRIVLPAAFCRAAGLRREVVMVGTGERIEVWSPEAWEAEKVRGLAEFRAAAERLGL